MKKVSLAKAFALKGERVELSNGFSVMIKPWTGFQAAKLWPPVKAALKMFTGDRNQEIEVDMMQILELILKDQPDILWDIVLGTITSPGVKITDADETEVDLESATADDIKEYFPIGDIMGIGSAIWRTSIVPLLDKMGGAVELRTKDIKEIKKQAKSRAN